MDVRFTEVNSSNLREYLEEILILQDEVWENLKSQGKEHLFFKSSKEEISDYINTDNGFVGILKSDTNKIISVSYFTFNHSVYNDLTLYIKNSQVYRNYILTSIPEQQLEKNYIHNLNVYSSLRGNGLLGYLTISEVLDKHKANDFFENEPLRQSVSKLLMDSGILSDPMYPWLKSTDLVSLDNKYKKLAKEYDDFISCFEYKYIKSPDSFDLKLAKLNDASVVELDTYYSAPKYRNQGCASALIEWAMKKVLSKRKISAISATVHPENSYSQQILDHFGFETFCTVERRKDIQRNVSFKLI